MSSASMVAHHSTVMDLTDRRIELVKRQVMGSNVETWISNLGASIFDRLMARMFKNMATKFSDDAIWFRGASQSLWRENADVTHVPAKLIARLDSLKSKLQSIRQRFLADLMDGNDHQSLRDAKQIMVASIADLFEAVEEFKWTIKELEANHSDRTPEMTADTPEGVADLFKKISHSA